MPSNSSIRWNGERAEALDEIENAHALIGGTDRGRRYATRQINCAYTALLSSHFQGFCRNLHSECVDHVVAATPVPLLPRVDGRLGLQVLDFAGLLTARRAAQIGKSRRRTPRCCGMAVPQQGEKTMRRCKDCGLLAIREPGIATIPSHTADEEVRETAAHANHGFDDAPFCYVNAFRIDKEYREIFGKGPALKAFLLVLNTPRECASYCDWDHLKSPPEHAKMIEQLNLSKIQTDQRREDLDRAERIRQADQVRDDRHKDREFRLKILIAVAAGVGGIVGYFWVRPQPQPQPVFIQLPATNPK